MLTGSQLLRRRDSRPQDLRPKLSELMPGVQMHLVVVIAVADGVV